MIESDYTSEGAEISQTPKHCPYRPLRSGAFPESQRFRLHVALKHVYLLLGPYGKAAA